MTSEARRACVAQPLAEQVAATLDWGTTPLGPRDSWPAGLGAVVATMLASPLPMALVVGQDLTLLYNDAYAEIITSKHPDAFGRPAAEVFAENWEQPGHGD